MKLEHILKIRQVGDPVLRQVARALSHDEIHSSAVQELITHMQLTMRDAPGVGLAAPQIGQSLQLVVIEDRSEYSAGLSPQQLKERQRSPTPFQVIINPKLTIVDARPQSFFEGCLSIAGFVGVVSRALAVKVEALNEHAEPITLHAQGWLARILQHETDHLQGKLCLDCTRLETFMTQENYRKFWL